MHMHSMNFIIKQLARLSLEDLGRLSKGITAELRRRRQAEAGGPIAIQAPPHEAAEKRRPAPISPLAGKVQGLTRVNQPRRAA
jgi:hypothetical protein